MATYVQMQVASEAYAIPVERVVEVARLGTVTDVPGSRPELLGVLSIRGHILPVVDLAQVLGISRPGPPSQLLVAESGGLEAGFAIDEVTEVAEMPEATADTESELLSGATLTDGNLIGVIDVPAVFGQLERARS
jgi:chemotaxis signal transduction protein